MSHGEGGGGGKGGARQRSIQLHDRCVRQSSLAMLYLIWSDQLQGTSILVKL